MEPQPPSDDAVRPPADARPGDTWSLDLPATPSIPAAPGEGPLPVEQAELIDPGGTAPPPPRQRGLKIVGVVLAAVLIVAGGAGAAAFLMLRGSGEVILDKVPADSDVVVTAYLDPAASQKINLLRMASRFPDLGDETHLRDQLNRTLDRLLADVGMNHDDLSWVGSEVGFFVEVRSADDGSYALLIATDDEDAARGFLQRYREGSEQRLGTTFRTEDHDGVEVTVPTSDAGGAATVAIVDGVVVVGSDEDAVDAVIDTAHGGSPISEDPGFQRVSAALPEAKLGEVFVDAAQLVTTFGDQLAAAGTTTGVTNLSALDGIGISLTAEPEGLALDTVMKYDDAKLTDSQRQALSAEDHPNPLLELVPADALGMYAVEHLAASIQDTLDQMTRDTPGAAQQLGELGVTGPGGLLSQLTGDIAVEASTDPGPIGYGGALMVGTNDPDATQTWLDRTMPQLPLGETSLSASADGGYRIVHHQPTWETEEHGGVTITYAAQGAELPIAYAVVGDAAVVATSPLQIEKLIDVKASGESISSDPGFIAATATVPAQDGVLYVDVPAIVDAVPSRWSREEAARFRQEAGRYLGPIEAVVAGMQNEADEQRVRLFVRIP
jgi:Protein of unknown function (DUF3352)